jgi:cystathionine gamma-synthase
MSHEPESNQPTRTPSPATLAVTAGRPPHEPGAPVNVPVTLSSTYVAGGPVSYGRVTNQTWEAFEEVVGALEDAEAVAFASGMAAVSAAVAATVPPGGRVIVPERAYAGTLQLLDRAHARGTIDLQRVDVTDPDALGAACSGAALVWLESPTNPTMEVIDLRAAATAAHAAGARVVVDNTFATPLVQRPFDLGADLVVHSASKFLGGHSDVILGVTLAREADLLATVREDRTVSGAVPGPFETWLALRGVRTLPVRIRQAQTTAQVLAERLEAHPAVARVRYPGLSSDPGHAVARTQMLGFGAMLAFEHAGGADAAETTCERSRIWTHATSLGGVESTWERRARWDFEPASVPAALIRMSVGCEDVEDLWADLEQALA